jgi:hypothetical protein
MAHEAGELIARITAGIQAIDDFNAQIRAALAEQGATEENVELLRFGEELRSCAGDALSVVEDVQRAEEMMRRDKEAE